MGMIPETALEAAAVAIFQNQTGMDWESRSDVLKDRFLGDARAALEAAAPHIRAETLKKAALELMDVTEHDSRMPGIRFAVGFLSGQRVTK